MVQSPSWAANWFAASQEIPRISRNPKVHYRTHKHPPTPEQASRIWMFRNISVLQGGVVNTPPNTQAGGPPLVVCPRLLIQFIRSYHPYRRPFLYPQPEDAPFRGDRDPLHGIMEFTSLSFLTAEAFCVEGQILLRITYLLPLQVRPTATEYFHTAFELINHACLDERPDSC